MQMAPMAHGFELCAPDAAFSLATEVLQHLNLCFADELSLTELTNRFHVSTSHMIHMFKAQFGLPPIQYMVRRRIGEAQHLLRTTEDSAGDIGGQVGMINRNYFYRMFKRLVGVSPVRYREVIGERRICWLEKKTLWNREAVGKTNVFRAASRSKPRFRFNFGEKSRLAGTLFLPLYKFRDTQGELLHSGRRGWPGPCSRNLCVLPHEA